MTGYPTIRLIAEVVAEHAGISYLELVSERRPRRVWRSRMMAVGLARRLTPDSFPRIGLAFGGRDHTTVQRAARMFEENVANDAAFAAEAAEIEQAVLIAAKSLERIRLPVLAAEAEQESANSAASLAARVAVAVDATERIRAAGDDLKRATDLLRAYVDESVGAEAVALAEAESDADRLRHAASEMVAALATADAANFAGNAAAIAAARKRIATARSGLCRAISPPEPDDEDQPEPQQRKAHS